MSGRVKSQCFILESLRSMFQNKTVQPKPSSRFTPASYRSIFNANSSTKMWNYVELLGIIRVEPIELIR